MTAPALQLSHVFKSFGKLAVISDFSMQLSDNQVVALLGENGAGKSTLMRLVTGFLPPDRGAISVGGHSLSREPRQAKASLGYLPENAPVHPACRVVEALSFPAAMHGLSGQAARKAVDDAVSQCQLGDVRDRMASQLSKGYRHRLGLAQAILHHPRLLVLDEPTDGLDPTQKESTRQLIRRLGESCTVLVSTHLLDEVPSLCSRVLMMAKGRLVYDGAVPADLPAAFAAAIQAPANISI